MKIAAKRGRFPAKIKKRLKFLSAEIKEQKELIKSAERSKQYSPYYQVAEQILQACDWYYHDSVDIDTVMYCIDHALHRPIDSMVPDIRDKHEFDDDGMIKKKPRMEYEKVAVIYMRHQLRPHDLFIANMIYLIDNTVGMWYDGDITDKLVMHLLDDYANVLLSVWSGRKWPLEHRGGK